MKKLIFCLFLLTLLLAGCRADDDTVLTSPSVSIRLTDNGYAAYAVPDGSLLGVFTDYREMRYYRADGDIAVSHVLAGRADDGVTLSRVTAHGIETLAKQLGSVTFLGDYIVVDSVRLFDGGLTEIGLCAGKIESAAPVGEGGCVTFASTEDRYTTLFPLLPPADGAAEEVCLTLSGIPFAPPTHVTQKMLAVAYPDTETAEILYRESDSSLRVLKITLARVGGESTAFARGSDSPAVPAEPAEYPGRYAAFVSGESAGVSNPKTTWLRDEAGQFTALCGTLETAGSGTMLLRGAVGATYIDTYFVYDRTLQIVAVLDDAVVLEGGDILGKAREEEALVRYGADGEEIFRIPFEAVWAVDSDGAAVCVNGQLYFTDTAGALLSAADGYRESMLFDRQMSQIRGACVFYDPATGDTAEFRRDIES